MAAKPRPDIQTLCPCFEFIVKKSLEQGSKENRVTIKKRDWVIEILSDSVGGAYFAADKYKDDPDRYCIKDIWRDASYESFVTVLEKVMASYGWKLWYNIKVRDINAERQGSEVYHEDFSTNWDIYLTLRKDFQYDEAPELDCWYQGPE